jgi:hypothetical protein
MARPASPAVAARNHEIYSLWERGSSLVELGRQFKITPQRAGQIVAAFHPEDDEDIDRSLYRGYLWRLFEEVRDLYRAPGYKMSPTGRPAQDPDGDPAEDTNVKLQAAELELKIIESLRKMDARDRPQRRQVTWEMGEAARAAAEDLEQRRAARDREIAEDQRRKRELEVLARQAGQQVVPGEVVREIGSGQSS